MMHINQIVLFLTGFHPYSYIQRPSALCRDLFFKIKSVKASHQIGSVRICNIIFKGCQVV